VTAAVRYDHTLPGNFFYNAGVYFGSYGYQVSDGDPVKAFTLNYKITYPSLKIDFNHTGARNSQSFGFHSTYYIFHPGDLQPTTLESNIKPTTMLKETAIESALYFGDVFNWTTNL